MEPPKSEGERWRRMPLSDVADAAMDSHSQITHKHASTELQRRMIQALSVFHDESEISSKRLLRATLVNPPSKR